MNLFYLNLTLKLFKIFRICWEKNTIVRAQQFIIEIFEITQLSFVSAFCNLFRQNVK